MRRGRPALRDEFRRNILYVLDSYSYPCTVSTIKKLIDEQRVYSCSRDTVRKYLHELIADGLVLRQELPTNRGRKPLIVYQVRRGRTVRSDFSETFSTD